MPTSTLSPDQRPPYPPFTLETAKQKVKAAQAAWNTKSVLVHIFISPDPIAPSLVILSFLPRYITLPIVPSFSQSPPAPS